MVEVEGDVECPHCKQIFTAQIEIEPMDWNDLD